MRQRRKEREPVVPLEEVKIDGGGNPEEEEECGGDEMETASLRTSSTAAGSNEAGSVAEEEESGEFGEEEEADGGEDDELLLEQEQLQEKVIFYIGLLHSCKRTFTFLALAFNSKIVSTCRRRRRRRNWTSGVSRTTSPWGETARWTATGRACTTWPCSRSRLRPQEG